MCFMSGKFHLLLTRGLTCSTFQYIFHHCRLFESLAEYRFLEASEWYRNSDFVKARQFYTESEFWRMKALDVIAKRKIERTTVGGHNMLAYAILLRCWSLLL